MSNQTAISMSQVFGTAAGASTFCFGPQKSVFPNTSTPSPPQIPEAREAETPQMTQTLSDAVQIGSNSAADAGVRATTNVPRFGQAPSMFSGAQSIGNQTNPEVNPGMANQTAVSTSSQVFGAIAGASTSSFVPQRMTEDRYTGAPGEVACDVCTEPKRRAEKSCLMCVTSYCSDHLENHFVTQRLRGHKLVDPVANLDERTCLRHGRPLELFSKKDESCICVLCMKKDQVVVPTEDEWDRKKAMLANIKLELREKIHKRMTRIDEMNESLRSCEDQLDDEQADIDAVFRAVIAIVEEAYAAALQPLRDRRQLVEQEAKDIEEKLETEIQQLERNISELEDVSALEDHILFLQTYPSLQDPDNIEDFPEGELDTSLSFGTMRTITETMLESIQQELEKLTPIELQRIPKFTVDINLDPTTAHQCLEISDDGKEVKDCGENQRVPDSLERFDMHGSILGLNRFSSGKSYWEVKVRNKAGWDLGVARGRAKRKGRLSLTPDNGYWVTVHFDEDKYAALTVPPVALSLEEKPQTVGVFVDYEEGLVSFYDVTSKSHIFSFTACSFSGEILPYFSPHVSTDDTNEAPLVISSLRQCEQEINVW